MEEKQKKDVKYSVVEGDENYYDHDDELVCKPDAVQFQLRELNGSSMIKEQEAPKTSKKFLYFAVIAVNISAFVCGIGIGWTSPEIPKLNGLVDPHNNPLPDPITEAQGSWVGSLLSIGAAIGPFPAGLAADKFGRKKTLLASIQPFIFAFLIFAYARSVIYFCVGRFLMGLGVGAVFTVLPNYVAEISEDSVRGILASFLQLFVTMGLLFTYAFGPYVSVSLFNFACAVPCLGFIFVFFMFVPESPHYLAVHDKQAAEKALKKLRCCESVEKELQLIQTSVDESLATKANFMDIFKSKGLTKALLICLGLMAFQQLSGITIILFYTQTIFLATGSSIPADFCTIIVGAIQFLGSFIAPIFVEKRGKRFLLLTSAAGMFVSQAVLGYYFFLKDGGSHVQAIFWLPIACLIGYNLTYCAGFGPLPWAVMGEVFPANIKSSASTVSASFCWALSFIMSKFFSTVVEAIGSAGSFWIFAACCFVAFVFVYKFVPETSGKSLEEIQKILNGD